MPTIITGAIGEADLYSVSSFKRDVGTGIALLVRQSVSHCPTLKHLTAFVECTLVLFSCDLALLS